MVVFKTERLELCHLNTDDAEFILELVNTPGWIKYIGDKNIKDKSAAKQMLSERYISSYREHGYGLYLVRTKTEKVSIGTCGIINRPSLPHPDIGFAFLPAFSGKGYGYEAASATLQYAKEKLGLDFIMAITKPSNNRSIHLLEKIGLRQMDSQIMEEDNGCLLFGKKLK